MLFFSYLVVVLLESAYLIGPSNAQPIVNLSPQQPQSVCQGGTLSFNCQSDGSFIQLYSPPIINRTQALSLFSSEPLQTCNIITNVGAASLLVSDTDMSTFVGTLTLHIPPDQNIGTYQMICRGTNAQGITNSNSSTFTVSDNIDRTSELTLVVNQMDYDRNNMVMVNISWNSLDSAEHYILIIKDNSFSTSQNYIRTTLPYGMNLSATICVINSCGKYERSFELMIPEPATESQMTNVTTGQLGDNIGTTVSAVVAGILGGLLILVFVVETTCICCLWKEKEKLKRRDIELK